MTIRNLFWIVFFVLTCAAKGYAFSIDDLKVDGVPLDQVETVKTITGVLPGDEYDENRVARARERVQELYVSKGYPEVKVKTRVIEDKDKHRLVFDLELGKPIRISSVLFISKTPIAPDFLSRLYQVIDLKPGELFDRDRIKEMRRLIEAAIVSLTFVDSRVVDITTAAEKDGLQLQFVLELGQKVILSVQGNEYYSRSELMSLIEKQRALGLGRDYINVISAQLKDFYIDLGFRQVKVTPYSFEPHGKEPKKVVFEIEEGPRVQIRSIIVDGNESFTDSEWEDFFYKSASDRVRARIYNTKMVEDASKAMMDELKKRGYLSAKLIAMKTEEIQQGDAVNIRFFVSEGVQTRVQSVRFSGNHIFSEEELFEILGMEPGDPLNLVQLEDGLDRIKKEYRNRGYLNFSIANENTGGLVTYLEKNQFADISIVCAEGNPVILEGVEIFGNESTRRQVIEREFQIKIGEPLSENKVLDTEARLRRLGIFSQVNLDFRDSPTQADAKTMKVSVQEVIPGNRTVGVGFRNDLGIRGFGGISYANLLGMNHTLALDTSVNRRLTDFRFVEFSGQLSYTWPWALLGETTFRPSLIGERRQFIQFDAETVAFSANLDRMIIPSVRFSGALTYNLEKVRQFNARSAILNNQVLIGSVTPTLRLDLRDNPLMPRRGFFMLNSLEFASSALGSQRDPVPVSYARYQFRTDYYADFIPRVVWYTSIRGGWLRNLASPIQANGERDPQIYVPLIKQFALGGVNSIRGFVEQELNVQATDSNRRIQGYSTYVNYRTQMDFFATPQLSFGPFLDAGNLLVDDFSLGQLRYGSGLGMRYITPVGPVNFDWGFKLFPRPNETTNVFYFSLGVI